MTRVGIAARLGAVLALAFALHVAPAGAQPADPLPSWNDGPAKQAILDFVLATTVPGSPGLVPPEERLATFDQDGTLWVEHPIYSQLAFAFDRVGELAPEHPEWKDRSRSRPCSRATGRPSPSSPCATSWRSCSRPTPG
jgi:hypothetical protein